MKENSKETYQNSIELEFKIGGRSKLGLFFLFHSIEKENKY